MKLTAKIIKHMIKEEISKTLSEAPITPMEIYMDLMRKGGPDHFLSQAYEQSGMKCTQDMHYDQALRAYIDETDPDLLYLPDRIWKQITKLMKDTRR
jgi:Mg/Co/Ni transporter MgtE